MKLTTSCLIELHESAYLEDLHSYYKPGQAKVDVHQTEHFLFCFFIPFANFACTFQYAPVGAITQDSQIS